MKPIITWVRTNTVVSVLFLVILVLFFLLLRDRVTPRPYYSPFTSADMLESTSRSFGGMADSMPQAEIGFETDMMMADEAGAAPAPGVSVDRMVSRTVDLSILVKEVQQTVQRIQEHIASVNGYVITSTITSPTENPTASVSLRVPQDELDATRDVIKNLGLKVVHETVTGQDITAAYEDITEKLRILTENKARLEEIMAQATDVSEILTIQQEIFNLQNQIDSLTGRQQALEQQAAMSLMTVYISSDELALPYVPDNAWRPSVIFKRAVRSVVGTFQEMGSAAIWIGVYSVIWVPVLGGGYLLYKRRKNRTSKLS